MTATSHWQSRHILSDWASVMSHQRQSASCRSVPPARRLGRCSPLYETPRRLRPRSTEELRQWMKLRLQREESVDCGETIEMIPGGRDYVSQVRRSHECVDVFLRLPLLDGDKCARRGIGGEQIVGNATVVAPAWADERPQGTSTINSDPGLAGLRLLLQDWTYATLFPKTCLWFGIISRYVDRPEWAATQVPSQCRSVPPTRGSGAGHGF